MGKNQQVSGWGSVAPGSDVMNQVVAAMAQDPDIKRIEFVHFSFPGTSGGWDFNFETVEGVEALPKSRFYWEEFLT